jgi:hypothetical protein
MRTLLDRRTTLTLIASCIMALGMDIGFGSTPQNPHDGRAAASSCQSEIRRSIAVRLNGHHGSPLPDPPDLEMNDPNGGLVVR